MMPQKAYTLGQDKGKHLSLYFKISPYEHFPLLF